MKKAAVNTMQIEGLVRSIYAIESERMGINVPLELSDEDNGLLGACHYRVTRSMFGRVTDLDPAHLVSFNLTYMEKEIKNLLFTKRARKVAGKYVVLHTVRHELRHAWQTVNKKEVLMDGDSVISARIKSPFTGYGEKPQEADANEYAQSIDIGLFNVILEACTLNQDLAGKSMISKEDIARMRRVYKELFKLNIKLALGMKVK